MMLESDNGSATEKEGDPELKTAIGCDHTGFELKPAIIEHLKERRKTALDKGAFSHERADYPVYAKKVAGAVVS
ncbi:hypothetical protein C0674_02670 [Sporolactobacillus terrae]|uniref:Ribose-5-phosphate isomerase n=1 Tax=Sporolactobacillus terrae TaxID=269673 RepID=A0ABX5Q4N9_9BACL|nr:hypothetical protein C0674_02670 [Sporolactobacillus terrae]QAA24582.1 hypothetical protein C0679_02650 [Sporolactobacillus terrae]